MTVPASAAADPPSLLVELARMPITERVAFLRGHGELRDIVADLLKHIERLMLTDLAAALQGATAVMETADEAGEAVSQIRARRALAQCFSYANRFNESLAVLEEGAALANQSANQREQAMVNMTRLHALARLGRLDEAVEAGEAARGMLLECGEESTAAKADVNLGVVQRMRDRPGEALTHFDRAKSSFAGQPMIEAQIESNRAEALLDLHDFEGAEAAFRTALGVFVQSGADRAAAIDEGNLADLMGRQGRLGSALHHFEQARRRLEKGDAPGDAARLAGEVAEVQLSMGLLDEAARSSAEASGILEQQGMVAEAARVRITLGRALASLGQLEQAEQVLLQAAAEFETARQPQRAARAVLARAELLFLGDVSGGDLRAKSLVVDLLPTLQARPADAAMAYALLAAIDLRADQPESALNHTQAGLELAEPLGLAPLAGRLLHLRGQAFLKLEQMAEAVATLERAVEQIERIRGSLQADRFRTAFHATQASTYGDAVSAVLRSSASGTDTTAHAFALVERSRSRALLDLLSTGAEARFAQSDGAPEAQAQGRELSRWRARLNALYTVLHEAGGSQRSSQVQGGWQAEIVEAERHISMIESRLGSASTFGQVFSEPLTLSAAMEHIPKDAALLEYFVAGERLLLFTVRGDDDNGACRVKDLCSMIEILPIIQRLRFHIAGAIGRGSDALRPRHTENVEHELKELYRLLLEPVMGQIAGVSRLFIAPHGPLHTLPFHALRGPDGFLIEQFEVVSVPSASILAQLGRQQVQTREPLLVAVSDELAPAIDAEVEGLAAVLPSACILRASEATVAAVVENAAGAPLIHIAAHGVFSKQAPDSSGVRLADGWLTVREACRMQLDGAVVALSGCDTGRSEATAGDELLGLPRALLAAGAQSVLVSLWPVHDQTATELLVSTYKMWYVNGAEGQGRTLAAALRHAQVDMIRQAKHPAFWAPFFLVGTQ